MYRLAKNVLERNFDTFCNDNTNDNDNTDNTDNDTVIVVAS